MLMEDDGGEGSCEQDRSEETTQSQPVPHSDLALEL